MKKFWGFIGCAVVGISVFSISASADSPSSIVGNLRGESGSDVASLSNTKAISAAPTPVPTGDSRIGAIGGGHDVSPDGTASYSIPIKVPAGVGGLQPHLALSYNSGAGNGHQGVGWGLSGMSSITRCPSSFDLGGRPDAVDFDSFDRFCLDGMPLVAISGVYGKPNTEYRTQSETFSKVVSYGSVGSCTRNGVNVRGPEKFKVYTAAGEVLEYGFTEDSRVEAFGCSDVVKWALNKREDRFGNTLTVNYTGDRYEHLIKDIQYNGKKSRIAFNYVSRTDTLLDNIAGTTIRVTKLLNKIWVYEEISPYAETQALRHYTLNYGKDNATGYSRLESIRECAGTSGPCLADTRFTWSSESSLSDVSFNHPNSGIWPGHSGGQTNNFVGDYNGDGLTDMAASGTNGRWHVCLSNGSGFNCSFWGGHGGGPTNNFAGDYNGDGLTDMAAYGSDGRWHVCLSNGSGFNCSFWGGARRRPN